MCLLTWQAHICVSLKVRITYFFINGKYVISFFKNEVNETNQLQLVKVLQKWLHKSLKDD